MFSYVLGGLVALVLIALFSPVLWKKLKVKADVVVTKVTDVLDNPVEEANYDIKVAEGQVARARTKLTELVRDTKITEKELENKKDEAAKDRRVAESYANKGDEDNARKFLKKAVLAERSVTALETKVDGMKNVAEALRTNIDNHESRIELAKSKTSELTARIENAQLLDEYSSIEFTDSGLKALENLEKKVERIEAGSEAKAEVYGTPETVLVDEDVESELARLLGK